MKIKYPMTSLTVIILLILNSGCLQDNINKVERKPSVTPKQKELIVKRNVTNQTNSVKNRKIFSRKIDPSLYNIPPRADNIKWRYIGPGVGGSMFGIGISPANPKIIITGGDMGCASRTEDGGKSWQPLGGTPGNQPGEGGTWNVQFSVTNPNIVWIVGSSAYKSTDAGKTWTRNAPNKTFGGLAIDPANPDVVYISEGYVPRFNLAWVTGNVYKTVDGGKNWMLLPRPYGPAKKDSMVYRNYSRIVIDPNSEIGPDKSHQRVYIAGRGGFCRSEDGGESWQDLSGEFGRGQITDLVLANVRGKSILFLAVTGAEGFEKGGVYKSMDNGNSWVPVNNGLEKIIAKQSGHPSNKKLLTDDKAVIFPTILANSRKAPKRIYLVTFFGAARTDDLGETWVPIAAETQYVKLKEGIYAGVLKDNKVFKNDFGGGFDGVNCVVASDTNPDMVAVSDNDEVTISYDAGKTWTGVSFAFGEEYKNDAFDNKNLPPNKYTHKVKNIGQHNIVCDDIKMDPFDKSIYYAAFMDLGLNISRDGGVYWKHPTTGINAKGHAWSVAVDPANEGLVIVASKPYQKQTNIYRSWDRGETWEKIGLDGVILGTSVHDMIHSITIDLHSPVNSRTVFAATSTKGVFKSTDTGNSWTNITNGGNAALNKTTVMKIHPDNSDIIYLGTETGLYKTINGGKTWELSATLFEKVESISICKTAPDILYVCAHYPGKNKYWGARGLYKSIDAGKNWEEITPDFFELPGSIAVNPYDPDYIYAVNFLDTRKSEKYKMIIVRSKDGGKTWQNIGNDIAFCRGKHVLIDDFNPRHIFVLTRFAVIEGWDGEAPCSE